MEAGRPTARRASHQFRVQPGWSAGSLNFLPDGPLRLTAWGSPTSLGLGSKREEAAAARASNCLGWRPRHTTSGMFYWSKQFWAQPRSERGDAKPLPTGSHNPGVIYCKTIANLLGASRVFPWW